MLSEFKAVQKFLEPVRSPLLWRVIPWLFFSVGLVQFISLYPLIKWHHRQLYDDRFRVVEARLDVALSQVRNQPELLDQALDAAISSRMRGLALYTPDGKLIKLRGETPPLPPSIHIAANTYSSTKVDAHALAIFWMTKGPQNFLASAVLNIDQETKRQENFVLRAALLGIPSALIATLVGTLILLLGVILPVRRLRNELLTRDGAHASSPQDHEPSIDELDDVRSYVDRLEAARAAAQAMEALAITDELTSLYTRRYFNSALAQHLNLARRDKTDLSVMMIDLDFFKSINDTYGHVAGDEVLKLVAKMCRGALRTSDVLARFGGEEFVVLLPNTGEQGVVAVAEKVRFAIETAAGTPRPVTASIGTSSWSGDHDDPTGALMLQRADEALYTAKCTGRNRVVQYEATQQTLGT